MKSAKRLWIVQLAALLLVFSAGQVSADPNVIRAQPGYLELTAGGKSQTVLLTGSRLDQIKQASIASAAPDHFSLSLGKATDKAGKRQLLIKATSEAPAGVYRLRVLYSRRGGILLDPRLLKIIVMPPAVATNNERKNGRAGRKVAVPKVVAQPDIAEPVEPVIADLVRSVPIDLLESDDDIPPEPEVVDTGDEPFESEVVDNELLLAEEDEQDVVQSDIELPLLKKIAPIKGSDNSGNSVSKAGAEGSALSAAMLAEAMGDELPVPLEVEPAPAKTFVANNVLPVAANRSSKLALQRQAGGQPVLALIAPAAKEAFIKGYNAPVAGKKKVTKSEPRLSESPIDGSKVSPSEELSAEKADIADVAPVPPAVTVARPLATPSPRIIRKSRPRATLPKERVAEQKTAEKLGSKKPPKSETIEPKKTNSRQAVKEGPSNSSAKPVSTVSVVGMRALPVYWIRGMAPTAMLVGAVRNAETGEPVAGAELQLGSMVAQTTSRGIYSLPSAEQSRQLKVTADGYLPMRLTAPRQSGAQMDELDVSLRPIEPVKPDASLPDLMIVSPPTAPLCRGGRQEVRLRIFNAGNKPVKGYDVTLFARVWNRGDGQEGRNIKPVTITGPALAAGETRVVDMPVTIAADSLWAELTAEADANEIFDELRESNNRSNPRRIVVASLSDCEAADIALPDYAVQPSLAVIEADGAQGCQLEAAVTVANYSNSAGESVPVTMSLNDGENRLYSQTYQTERLSGGESRPMRFAAPVDAVLNALSKRLSLPSLLPDQSLTLAVEINAGAEAEESFNTNNRVEFTGRLSELVATENLLYRKRNEDCLSTL